VLYGDSYLPIDLRAVDTAFRASGKSGLMTVYSNEGHWDTSNVDIIDGRIVAYDKKVRTERMRHIGLRSGAFRATAFDRVPDGKAWDLAALYQDLLHSSELTAFEAPQRFYEIGSFTGIEELSGLSSTRISIGMSFSQQFLSEAKQVIDGLDLDAIERMVAILASTRSSGGRLFILGVGGESAANASHAVNDLPQDRGDRSLRPTDNVSELTARTNDEGWAGVFESWLMVSRLKPEDTLLIFSVGRRQPRAECQPESGRGAATRQTDGFENHGHRWGARRRLHGRRLPMRA